MVMGWYSSYAWQWLNDQSLLLDVKTEKKINRLAMLSYYYYKGKYDCNFLLWLVQWCKVNDELY